MAKKTGQPVQKAIDYQLHLAQQIEILNQNLELLKNNVYGQSQVEIVLFALSEGKTQEEAIEFSLDLIDSMNAVNAKRIEARRKEFEERLAAQKASEATTETPEKK